MPTIEFLKQNVDCHDLAEKLNWQRPGNRGNYRSPHRDDKTPSVSISADGRFFKDFTGAGKGSCIDMICYHDQNDDIGEAVKRLHDIYGWPMDKPEQQQGEKQQQSIAEFIAGKCYGNDDKAIEYLSDRGIDEVVVRQAMKKKTLGFNTYTNDKYKPGELFHGGPGVAFITRSVVTSRVVGVDVRYLDPDLNGGLKTMSHGDKNVPWTSDLFRLRGARTVYFVESPINALSIECCNLGGKFAVVATKGTEQAKVIDLHFMLGKQAVLCMDNDETNDDGKCPGPEAAWVLYERLTAMGVACQIVDQMTWKDFNEDFNDVNDILNIAGASELTTRLKQLEEWVIPGQPGKMFEGRKPRLFLPAHDYAQYWRFRCKEDFTRWIKEMKQSDGDDADGTPDFTDLCGFRIASLTRVNIAGATSVMSGEDDTQINTLFAVSVQTPRHGNTLVKRVFEDERLHNLTHWNKFGPIYLPNQFNRLVNILERGAHLGARDAVNFVGVCWRNGRLAVNEGADCFFTEPTKQCPYHNLAFPSGPVHDARRVIDAYQSTFRENAAMMIVAWALGGHMKAVLGFWPHMIIQADKGSGKSTLIKRIERSIAFNMFSGQSLQTEYRLLTTISHTSHPVGWEEISARGQQVIDKAVSLLQESYQYTITRRGADLTEYLISAPVLLAGEDVPVRSLLGKVVRTQLAGKKGDLISEDLPRFPVREWLQFIAEHDRSEIRAIFARALKYAQKHCRSSENDSGADRMRENYAAVLTSWKLLCDFAGIETSHGNFKADCLAEMNHHIGESVSDRDPWIWIIETIFDEISSDKYSYPYKFMLDHREGFQVPCLVIRHTHIMSHLKNSMWLRDTWNSLPVKSKGVLLRQLQQAGVIHRDRVDTTLNGKRESHMIALDLQKLEDYGIYVSLPESLDHMPVDVHSAGQHAQQLDL